MPLKSGLTPQLGNRWEDGKVDKAKTGFLIFILLIVLLSSGCAESKISALGARIREVDESADRIQIDSFEEFFPRTGKPYVKIKSRKVFRKNSSQYKRLVAALISSSELKQRHRHLVAPDRLIVFKSKGRKLLKIYFASEYNIFSVQEIGGGLLLPVSGRKLVE